jgi:hypothetical protein
MIPNRNSFRIVFSSNPDPVSDVWLTISSFLKREGCLPSEFRVSQIAGHAEECRSESRLRLTPEEIVLLIEKRNLYGFGVDTGHSENSVGYELTPRGKTGGQSVLSCRIESKAKAPKDWNPLLEGLMNQWCCIGGWQWKILYNSWQNANSTKYYETRYGHRPSGLVTYMEKSIDSLKSDRELIDVSLNPGRSKELASGLFFIPSAEMWLGPDFWQYAKCTKEEALSADFFLEKRDTPHFLYLKSWPRPFSRPDGEQGRQQQKIWRLFFNEDCEWPPGSGTICDEPMYGPPELMP